MEDIRKDGTSYFAELSLNPVLDRAGKVTHFIGIQRDVTTDVALEKLQGEHLSMATLAHDLRSPLWGGKQVLEHILGGKMGELSEELQSILSTLSRSNLRLLNMVKNFLDMHRLQAGSLVLSQARIDPGQLVLECVAEINILAKSRSQKITCHLDSNLRACRGDRDSLSRVLLNLLDNAVKYTGDGGTISVSAGNRHETVQITITDSGQGMSPEAIQRLFRPFSRVGSTSNQPEGWGLGLYLCKKLIEAHGGQIGCRSQLGSGTTITVTLPAP